MERGPERKRHLVHAIDGAGGADAGGGGGDVDACQATRVGDLGIQHDGRNALEMLDGRLWHRGPGVGA